MIFSTTTFRLAAGGKPSTWFPPGGLVETTGLPKATSASTDATKKQGRRDATQRRANAATQKRTPGVALVFASNQAAANNIIETCQKSPGHIYLIKVRPSMCKNMA